MSAVFLDTGYLIALEAADDQNHAAAERHWSNFRKAPPPLVTTSFVLTEVVTFFNSRKRHEKAVELGRMLLTSPAVNLIHVDEPLFHRGWEFFQQRPDKTYSLTDCVSFLVMQDQHITQALTLDQHFVQAGFQKLP
jgi:predicted nucleic acid-binding protein